MPARNSARRTIALAVASAAVLVGAVAVGSPSALPSQHSVADSTWGGAAPANPGPTSTPTEHTFTPLDSTWGG